MDHEHGVARFLLRERRDRFTALLDAGGKHRAKALSRLAHFRDLDPRWLTAVPALDHREQMAWIRRTLVEHGAPSVCYVVSERAGLDGQSMALDDALEAVIGQGFGTLVSCIPGRLAFFEGEDPGDRWIIRRPAG